MTDNAQAWTVYNSLMVDPLTHTVYSAGEEVHLPEMESGFLCFSPKPPVQSFSAIGILSVFFLPGPMVFA